MHYTELVVSLHDGVGLDVVQWIMQIHDWIQMKLWIIGLSQSSLSTQPSVGDCTGVMSSTRPYSGCPFQKTFLSPTWKVPAVHCNERTCALHHLASWGIQQLPRYITLSYSLCRFVALLLRYSDVCLLCLLYGLVSFIFCILPNLCLESFSCCELFRCRPLPVPARSRITPRCFLKGTTYDTGICALAPCIIIL